MKKQDRRHWPKVSIPEELLDLFAAIAKANGYREETWYLFIYQLLKTAHPEDVEKLTDYLNARKYDRPPPE